MQGVVARAAVFVAFGVLLALPLPAEDVPEAPAPDAPAIVNPESVPEASPEEAEVPPVAADPFPLPEGLRGHVDFWTNVFGVWSTRQVAIHDLRYPGLVYEVVDLPDATAAAGVKAEQHLVRARRDAVEARLRRLEVMVDMKVPLTEEEKDLALLVATRAGTDALRGAAERVREQRGIRERFRRGLEISGRYDALFRKIFRDAGLPEDLACLPHVESSFQAAARSSAGAVGIWQFTRGAARVFMNLTSSHDDRLDPVASARGAARYLRAAHERLGDWALAVTSYNHGVDGMARARERFGTDFDRIVREYDGKLFGFASKNFYAEFLAARMIATKPETYFPEGIAYEPPRVVDEVVLRASVSPQRVAQTYGVPLRQLAELNPGWTRRAVRGGRALPVGVSVWLPEGTLDRIAAARAPGRSAPVAPVAPAASTSASASTWADVIVHVVRRGETLLAIASRHRVRLADLLAANALSEETVIRPGQQLRIPVVR